MYTYVCLNCGTKTEVVRSFKDIEVPPEAAEDEVQTACTTEASAHKWDRIIQGKVAVVKAPGFGSKGNW